MESVLLLCGILIAWTWASIASVVGNTYDEKRRGVPEDQCDHQPVILALFIALFLWGIGLLINNDYEHGGTWIMGVIHVLIGVSSTFSVARNGGRLLRLRWATSADSKKPAP
jgi:hypothetical protein